MIEIILDASQIETFEACPRKWYYSYLLNLETRKPNPALSTGSFFHEVLKFYYSANTARHETIRPALEYALILANGPQGIRWPRVRKDPKFHIDRLRDYFYHNLSEDEQMQIVTDPSGNRAVERGFSWLLYEDTHRRYILEGMIDLISVKRTTGLTVTDHKTQSRDYDKYFYNHQAMNYLSFTGASYFEYNYIGLQKTINDATFSRPIWKPPPRMLDQWKIDVKHTFDEMFRMVERDTRLVYGSVDGLRLNNSINFPRRREACQTKFGVCQFSRICEVPDSSPWQPIVINSKYQTKEKTWKAWS